MGEGLIMTGWMYEGEVDEYEDRGTFLYSR